VYNNFFLSEIVRNCRNPNSKLYTKKLQKKFWFQIVKKLKTRFLNLTATLVLIIALIHKLLKKNVDFIWESKQIEFMNKLKQTLISSLVLIFIDYSFDVELIIRNVNANFKKWDDVLMQLIANKRHSIRYKSEIWSNAKAKYDATKRECREMLKILKKIRF
jgi:hypothetical protein